MPSLLIRLLDFLFPPRCCICRDFNSEPLCAKCQGQVVYLNDYFSLEGQQGFCIGVYEGVLKKAVWQLKFQKRTELLSALQAIIADNFPAGFRDADLLVPVPLSARRLKDRGFNQAERLLQKTAQALNKPVETSLVQRTKDTRPLFTLKNESDRHQELDGAFVLTDPDRVRGKSILLFDDIITTGTTILTISKLLTEAGAKSIYVLGLARTL
ncbi:ComF family protein [Candidatus Margulisiibacteriota bacterium]